VIEARAQRAGIAVIVEAPPLPVELDARRIKEALLNLLLNAIDATPAGGRIRLAAAATAGGVELRVEDTGAGMDAARLAAAATPFATGREGGTGLGLALARQAAEQHGGALIVDSAGPGRGSVARLSLPRRAEAR
jgi:signal transduction histidine kinase